MKYLLDTNTCVAFFQDNKNVVSKIKLVGIDKLQLCSVVKAELWYGACKSGRIEVNQAHLREFFTQISSVPFDDNAVEHYGEIRAFLSKIGKPIGANDFLIAAIALAHDLTVVTHNTREFERVPNLKLEDWLL